MKVIAFDPALWLPALLDRDAGADRDYFSKLGVEFDATGRAPASGERFFETAISLASSAPEPTALIADFAARLIVRPQQLIEIEHRGFTRALVTALAVAPKPHPKTRLPVFNPLIWIVEKEGDLPDWFVVGNPRLRHIPIPKPDPDIRRTVVRALMRTLPSVHEAEPEALAKAENAFVDDSEGLLVLDLDAITRLSRTEGLGVTEAAEAVRRYKLGVTEDRWRKIDREKVSSGEALIASQVKGQAHAVQHMLDIIKRAAIGLGGRQGGHPRGVAFMAGPTGVGKTELAKAVTRLLFGDERAYIRFDMSEFSAEHADQRLIGAPPGYIGYDTGGELTNAIREKPFSVILFDEIEKAHPKILDKFLQILDDGVLTSGRGERVYFSESLIIFTSNLGITREFPDGSRVPNVSASDPFETVRERVRAEISEHFKIKLGRPEILNRIGENIIVFDFIRPDIASQIFDAMLRRVIEDVRAEQRYEIEITADARGDLKVLCLADLSNGGRGVRNQVEAHFLNPLARSLFSLDPKPDDRVLIDRITHSEGVTSISAALSPPTQRRA